MIDKEEFKEYILSGKTIPELQEIYNCTRNTIAQYKRDFGFVGLTPNSRKRDLSKETKLCSICNKEKMLNNFYSNGRTPLGNSKYKPYCIPCDNARRDKLYRDNIIKYLESCNKDYSCELCGYTGIWGSLDFHHVRPEDKLFSIGAPSSKTLSAEKFEDVIVPELDKCMLLCPNCHRQKHLLMG